MSLQDVSGLYQNALSFNLPPLYEAFKSFDSRDAEDLVDYHLLKAQIKLFLCDKTALDDLHQAKAIGKPPRFPCLFSHWEPDAANCFFVFDSKPGSVPEFSDVLLPCGELLRSWYGNLGYRVAMQIKSEILYFAGELETATALSEELFRDSKSNYLHHVLVGYTLFRCYLAIGKIPEAESVILEIIRYTRESNLPNCQKIYRNLRDWANLTTGWSGDTPRYQKTVQGNLLPLLDDRIAAIEDGISALSSTEEPFAAYSKLHYPSPCTMRGLYMDIFHAIDAYRKGDLERAKKYFAMAYNIAKPNDLLMPYAEYGEQIQNFLQDMATNMEGTDSSWIDRVIELARRYEKNLRAYRN